MNQAFLIILTTLCISGLIKLAVGEGGFCSAAPSIIDSGSNTNQLYWKATNPTLSPSHLQDLPGFTRSVYKRDHALITPESHVFSPLPEWTLTSGAYLITPAMGSHFVMYLAMMQENSMSGLPPYDAERFIFVVQGAVTFSNISGINQKLMVDSYAYLPPNFHHSISCDASATLVVFERRRSFLENLYTEQIVGSTDQQPLLETPGEVFQLRKLIPTSISYDFNIHIMDFEPGEYLNVKKTYMEQSIWGWGLSSEPWPRSAEGKGDHWNLWAEGVLEKMTASIKVLQHHLPCVATHVVTISEPWPILYPHAHAHLIPALYETLGRSFPAKPICLWLPWSEVGIVKKIGCGTLRGAYKNCVEFFLPLIGQWFRCIKGGALQSAWFIASGGTGHLSVRWSLVPRSSRRCHLDGTICAAMVRCIG